MKESHFTNADIVKEQNSKCVLEGESPSQQSVVSVGVGIGV